jgi:membrane fusion protein, copper/silver efflux system
MKKVIFPAFILTILAVAFLAGSWYKQRETQNITASEGRRILYYVDPMNPSHTSDQPGLAPCGMKMEPVYADGAGQTPAIPSSMPPGTVKISPEKQQIIGVRVSVAEKTETTLMFRALGRVAADENRIHRVVSTTEGWVRRLKGGTTGSLVKKDQLLATFYSRDMLSGLQALFFAISTKERYLSANASEDQMTAVEQQIRAAEVNLRTLGVSEVQMKELERSHKPAQEIEIRAPVTGFLLARNVSPNLRFDRNTELYRIADLSRVWVLADIYGREARHLQPGSPVAVSLPDAGTIFPGKVSNTLPQFDAATRTLKVRLLVDNPTYALRPDMFVDVAFSVAQPPAIAVPVDAVLDSGLRKTVFVDVGNGFFEPRRVETGWRSGGRVEITGGLMPGERIVVSGNFLLDSESRMKLAAAGMYGTLSRDPVCGMDVDEGKAGAAEWKSTYRDKTYYFCSDECRREFEKAPERFVDEQPRMEGQLVAPAAEHAHEMHHGGVPGTPSTFGMDDDEGEPGPTEEMMEQDVNAQPENPPAPSLQKRGRVYFRGLQAPPQHQKPEMSEQHVPQYGDTDAAQPDEEDLSDNQTAPGVRGGDGDDHD